MPDLFRDDFENGKTPYVTSYNIPNQNGSSVVVQVAPAGMPVLNASCLQVDTLAVPNPTVAGPAEATNLVAVNVPTPDDIYVSVRILITQGIAELQTNDRIWYVILSNGMKGILARMGIRREGTAPPRWCLWARGLRGHMYGANVVSPTTSVIRVVLHFKASIGLYELYINDVLEVSTTVADADGVIFPDQVALGVNKTGSTGTTSYEPTGIFTTQTFMDAVVIATEYPDDTIVTPPKLSVTVMVNGAPVNGVPVTLDGVVQYSPAVFENVTPGLHDISVPPEIDLT